MKDSSALQPQQPRGVSLMTRLGLALLAGCLAWVSACGELRPAPAGFDTLAYKPIKYQALLHPDQAGLKAGDQVQVRAYFWQELSYDPAMVRNYLTLPRYPIRWYTLYWFATYGSERMTGYYDLAAMSPEQAEHYKLKRLDHILIYGELSRLGRGVFLQVHHIEKIEEP